MSVMVAFLSIWPPGAKKVQSRGGPDAGSLSSRKSMGGAIGAGKAAKGLSRETKLTNALA